LRVQGSWPFLSANSAQEGLQNVYAGIYPMLFKKLLRLFSIFFFTTDRVVELKGTLIVFFIV
jgi:hypothetical protein